MLISDESVKVFLSQPGVHRYYPKDTTKSCAISDWTVSGILSYTNRPGMIKTVLENPSLEHAAIASVIIAIQALGPVTGTIWTFKGNNSLKYEEIENAAQHLASFLVNNVNKTFNSFDEYWNVASEEMTELRELVIAIPDIKQEYKNYGLAQKWVNMAVKHLYTICHICKDSSINGYCDNSMFKYAACPIDTHIRDFFKKNFNLVMSDYVHDNAWTKLDNLEDITNYEKAMYEAVNAKGEQSLFKYEFENWT